MSQLRAQSNQYPVVQIFDTITVSYKILETISLFGSASHFASIVSWKAGSPTSNPQRLKAESVRLFVDLKQTQCKTTEIKINILQFKSWILGYCRAGAACCRSQGPQASGRESRQFFIASWPCLHGNVGDFCKMPQQMALETTNQKSLIETSLWQAWVWVAWIERGQQIWAQKIYAEESFESISDSQLKHQPCRCSGWIVTPNSIIHPYRFSDLFMNVFARKNSGNLARICENAFLKQTCGASLLSAVRHILQTSSAERLAAPLPTHRG